MRPLESQNSTGRKQIKKIPQLQTHATFHEKERMTQMEKPRAQKAKPGNLKNYHKAMILIKEPPMFSYLNFKIIMDQ